MWSAFCQWLYPKWQQVVTLPGADYQLNGPQSVWYCLLHTHIVLRALLRKRAEFGPGNPKGNWQVDKCSNFFCNTNTDLGVAKATFDS